MAIDCRDYAWQMLSQIPPGIVNEREILRLDHIAHIQLFLSH